MTSPDDNHEEDVDMEDGSNVKVIIVSEPKAATSSHALTHDVNLKDHTKDQSFTSTTTTHN
ncbi:unnamed protein product [Aureobasidium pullulans]|nr:unnamed protein product [Aureobasidium pullulans]